MESEEEEEEEAAEEELDGKVKFFSLINPVRLELTSISNAELMSPFEVQSVKQNIYGVIELTLLVFIHTAPPLPPQVQLVKFK